MTTFWIFALKFRLTISLITISFLARIIAPLLPFLMVFKPKKAWKIKSCNEGIFVFMAQHSLLSAKVRNLSLTQIAQLTDADILSLLKMARWGNAGKVTCPRCHDANEAYFISSRQQWQCQCCQYRFLITAGTLFHLSKLSLRQIFTALYLFTVKSKGISAVELSHELGVQYKTAWVLLHKFREALDKTQEMTPLKGEVHIDGCYVNHYIRPRNFRRRRIDRRKRCYQREDKACLMVFRQRAANQSVMQGADRSIVALIKEENTTDVVQLTRRLVTLNSTVFADENPTYDSLAFYYDLWRVNHS